MEAATNYYSLSLSLHRPDPGYTNLQLSALWPAIIVISNENDNGNSNNNNDNNYNDHDNDKNNMEAATNYYSLFLSTVLDTQTCNKVL